MQAPRIQRLENQFQQEIALIVQRELKDPRLGFITITKVELLKDLSQARVSFSCLGDQSEKDRCQIALDNSAGFIHSLIKKRLRLKVIPKILFQYDHSIARSIEMADMLDKIMEQGKTTLEDEKA